MRQKRTPFDHLLETGHRPSHSISSYAQSSDEDRSSKRHVVDIDAAISFSDEDERNVSIIGISQSGCTIEGAGATRIGERCQLIIPGMRAREIDIIWQKEDRAGACFANLLPRVVLEGLLLRFALYDFE